MRKFLVLVGILFLLASVDAFAKGGFSSGGGRSFSSSSSIRLSSPSRSLSSPSLKLGSSPSRPSLIKSPSLSGSTGSSGLSSTGSLKLSGNGFTKTTNPFTARPATSTTSTLSLNGGRSTTSTIPLVGYPRSLYTPSVSVGVGIGVPPPYYYGHTRGGLVIVPTLYDTQYAYFPHYYGYGTALPVVNTYDNNGYQEAVFNFDNVGTIKVAAYQPVDSLQQTDKGVIITLKGTPYTFEAKKANWLFFYADTQTVKVANGIVSSSGLDWGAAIFGGILLILVLIVVLSVVGYFIKEWLQNREYDNRTTFGRW